MISDLSSSTLTTSSAAFTPPLPLRNLPGPNTEQVEAFKIAHNSNPIAQAVNDKYRIYIMVEVLSGNSIFNELNPKPAIMDAIPAIPL